MFRSVLSQCSLTTCPGSSSHVSAVHSPRQNPVYKMLQKNLLHNSCRSTARFSRIQVRSSILKFRMLCLSVSLRALDYPLRVGVATPVTAPNQQIPRRSLSLNPTAHHHEPNRGSPSAASPKLQVVVNGRRLEGSANAEFLTFLVLLDVHPLRIIQREPHTLYLPRETVSTSAQTAPRLRSR